VEHLRCLRYQAYPTNILLALKKFCVANTLDYFTTVPEMNKKSYLTLTPGANVLKVSIAITDDVEK
jgi:hypothetical protein